MDEFIDNLDGIERFRMRYEKQQECKKRYTAPPLTSESRLPEAAFSKPVSTKKGPEKFHGGGHALVGGLFFKN